MAWKTGFPSTWAIVRRILADWQWYNSIDLSQGYFYVPVCDVLRNLFAFECQGKRYKYNCLPRGWASSASAFHSRMCNILVKTRAIVYVDDILVGGKDPAEHDRNLGDVLARMQEAGMHINKSKVQLSKPHVLFLGYDI